MHYNYRCLLCEIVLFANFVFSGVAASEDDLMVPKVMKVQFAQREYSFAPGSNMDGVILPRAIVQNRTTEFVENLWNYEIRNISLNRATLGPLLTYAEFNGNEDWVSLYGAQGRSYFTKIPYYFSGCSLKDAYLRNASFAIDRAETVKTNMSGAYLDHCEMYGVPIAMLAETRNMKKEKEFIACCLGGIDFKAFNFTDFVFTRSEFSGCDFTGCTFTNAKIDKCVFDHRFEPENSGLTLAQIKQTWNYKTGNMTGIKLPPDIQKALDEEKAKK